MMPAKSLTWTESKEGDALCYDVPTGNYHCCNGDKIKFWKHVNAPSEVCPKCHQELSHHEHANFCPNCGEKLEWFNNASSESN